MMLRVTVTLLFLHTGFAHKCYVCAPGKNKPEDITQLKRTFPNVKIPLCSEYSAAKDSEYLIECPHTSGGCLTKFEGDGSVMRTCATIGIDDCKTANSVNYCYCSKDGCNTPDRFLAPPGGRAPGLLPRQGHEIDFSAPRIQSIPSDDEDAAFEGSGSHNGEFYYDYYEMPFSYDTEPGDGGPDFSDVTEPPPFIADELEEELQKIAELPENNRESFNGITIDDSSSSTVVIPHKGSTAARTEVTAVFFLSVLSVVRIFL